MAILAGSLGCAGSPAPPTSAPAAARTDEYYLTLVPGTKKPTVRLEGNSCAPDESCTAIRPVPDALLRLDSYDRRIARAVTDADGIAVFDFPDEPDLDALFVAHARIFSDKRRVDSSIDLTAYRDYRRDLETLHAWRASSKAAGLARAEDETRRAAEVADLAAKAKQAADDAAADAAALATRATQIAKLTSLGAKMLPKPTTMYWDPDKETACADPVTDCSTDQWPDLGVGPYQVIANTKALLGVASLHDAAAGSDDTPTPALDLADVVAWIPRADMLTEQAWDVREKRRLVKEAAADRRVLAQTAAAERRRKDVIATQMKRCMRIFARYLASQNLATQVWSRTAAAWELPGSAEFRVRSISSAAPCTSSPTSSNATSTDATLGGRGLTST